jgi:hypothetical protein
MNRLPLSRFTIGLLILTTVGLPGCAASHGAIRTFSGPEPATLPFSTQSGFFSRADSSRIELSGISGKPVTLIKRVAGMDPRSYQIFDGSTVFIPDGLDTATAGQYERTMRRWVEDRIRLRGLTVGDAKTSQAGVSVVFTPFRSLSGRTAFEIVVIVFDRKKGVTILKDSYEKQGIHVVLESAVWMSVSRLYPTLNFPPWPDPADRNAAALLETLFDSAFANFLAAAPPGNR